ncbi:beta-ketoacyl-ACP synthase III [Hirschia baltica]|uniref:Beta-ketoacyl-acyl-carrier-protein synthase III n=1 Tax=Hirschia baltica (strain ATCC 49814 / DSM 5838 / IFAM 1418) TaxID=582402 RepID=C6XS10_HIRBI|nr:beta-ketoacyl-ACP synthase III [Hirschia baltica]ACT60851.1 Beta-ketoacyl-acyl-carrier-protein synthase III [Hirschia baltica ATCC 49814]
MTARISATGLWTPPNSISNEELVESYNSYVERFNTKNANAIETGEVDALAPSSSAFIEKASGIKARYVLSKEPILDNDIMAPRIAERPNDEISVLAEMAVKAGKQALERAGRKPEDVDAVIVACSNLQRAYPAIAIEVQKYLGTSGFAFDMNVACSSATFGIETARGLILGGQAKSVLVCSPEICTSHMNFKDRDSHFIFGDVATAVLVESEEKNHDGSWEIIGSKLITEFSNNIRNNFGFLNHAAPEGVGKPDKLFVQNGRSVFKEVVPMVAQMITDELAVNNIAPDQIKRMWLHQANINMNNFITQKVLGKDADISMAPVVLDEYANTSSAGSIIAFDKYNDDFTAGDIGLICSFGAGYSAGLIIVRKT